MVIAELTAYKMACPDGSTLLNADHLALSRGDVCTVESESAQSPALLFRALATLSSPVSGTYRFMGEVLDFTDYRLLLPFKRKIGYIGHDAALLSNRTIKENLLLGRHYFENNLSIGLDEWAATLCRTFNISEKLDIRPSDLTPAETMTAVMIREMTKPSALLLIDRPEGFMDDSYLRAFADSLQVLIKKQIPVVMHSNENMMNRLSEKTIRIRRGAVTVA